MFSICYLALDRHLQSRATDELRSHAHQADNRLRTPPDSPGSIYLKCTEFQCLTSFRFLQRFVRFLWVMVSHALTRFAWIHWTVVSFMPRLSTSLFSTLGLLFWFESFPLFHQTEVLRNFESYAFPVRTAVASRLATSPVLVRAVPPVCSIPQSPV